jgi:tetratricopeptide (TPR) repeat protein
LYEQVKPRDNRLIAGYMGLGYVQEDLERLDEALETFKTLLAHCANSDIHSLHVYRNAAHKELAFIYSKKADEEINKLIDYNEYRIAEHPNDYQLLNDIGAFYEKVELAISNVARVDTIHTLRIELYQNILNNTGIPDEMVDAAYQLVKIHSNDHDFAKVSAVLNLLENRINKADQLHLYSLYNLACTYALARKTDQAISYLDRSIKEGFDQFDWAKNDPDLESIRDLDQFKKLVNKKQ